MFLIAPFVTRAADAPTITKGPVDASVTAGMSATLSVEATGTAPLTYQWYKDGAPVGPNMASYLLTQIMPATAGSYTVKVTNGAGSVTSAPAVLAVSSAPVINRIDSATHTGGVDSITFTVYAYGVSLNFALSGPYTYAQTPTTTGPGTGGDGFDPAQGYYKEFKIVPLTAADVGYYRLVVSNSAGSVTRDLIVTLNGEASTPPTMSVNLGNHAAVLGQATTLGVTAIGATPIAYQWYFNGVAITGATNSTYTIPAMGISDAGTYTVSATNPFGAATSAPGVLTYLPALRDQQTSFTGDRTAISPGALPTGSVQWQVSTDGGSTWSDIADGVTYAGTTSATLEILSPTDGMAGYRYRYRYTVSDNTVYSNSTFLDVKPPLLTMPVGIAVDASGALYVTDAAAQTVLKIGDDLKPVVLAGSKGELGSRDGTGAYARFNEPSGIVLNPDGTIMVADTGNSTIRKILVGNTVTTFDGSAGMTGTSEGIGTAARFNTPVGMIRDATGNYYVADQMNQLVRILSPSGVSGTMAGKAGIAGSVDSVGLSALFDLPTGIAIDSQGALYVSDQGSNVIRKITPAGQVTTIAGSAGLGGAVDGPAANARFNQPKGLVVSPAGDIYVADTGNSIIRKISQGMVTTLAGNRDVFGIKDGRGKDACFNQPEGIALSADGTTLFVADTGNAAIRSVSLSSEEVTTLALITDAPVITSQPSSATTTTGSAVSFAVTASSAIPLTYQWKKDGGDIAGATSATYSISSVAASDAGNYTVAVSNTYGSATSTAATLTVNTPTTPPSPSPGSSGGGGGGGAPSLVFLALLGLAAGLKTLLSKRQHEAASLQH